jgi:lipopolysaccharide/colanic/teichoic acid biosynthesis glycosyltransferase
MRTRGRIVQDVPYVRAEINSSLDDSDSHQSAATGSDSHRLSTAAAFAADCVSVPLWKRVLDISCAFIAIPSLLPMMLLIALVVKIGSKGPVLFKQERVGLLGKRFTIFKFRTMIAGTGTAVHEAYVTSLIETNGPMTKLDAHGDTRLIPFGRMLRAAGLDELPQLINVLRGDMSLVGPRPCLPNEFSKYLPSQRERFRALPGLTGLWQVSGKNRKTFNEMVDLDIQYVRTQSVWLDLKIMLKTIPVVMVEVRDIQGPATPKLTSRSTDQTPRG